MDVYEVRIINARRFSSEYDTLKSFAEHCGISPGVMSRLISTSCARNRNIGSQAARQIEKACGKPPGWLDINHSTVSASQISAEEVAIQFSALSREISIIIENYSSGKISRERQLEAINAMLKIAKSING